MELNGTFLIQWPGINADVKIFPIYKFYYGRLFMQETVSISGMSKKYIWKNCLH